VKKSNLPTKCQVCGVEGAPWQKCTRDGVRFFQRYRCHSCHQLLATQVFKILFIIHIFLGIAGAILLVKDRSSESGHVLVNLFWLTAFLYCAVLMHEFAHAFAGQLAGFRIVKVSVGCGATQFVFRRFKFPVEIGSIPCGGITWGEPTRSDHSRLRSLAFIGAAPAANLLIGVSVWYLTGRGPSLSPTSTLTNIFVLANLWAAVESLVPFSLLSPYGFVRSDGLQLIKLLFPTRASLPGTTWTGSSTNVKHPSD
jgi:hypothetical protein